MCVTRVCCQVRARVLLVFGHSNSIASCSLLDVLFSPTPIPTQKGFPREFLLADPESVTYEALGLVKGVRQTFFGSEVRGDVCR